MRFGSTREIQTPLRNIIIRKRSPHMYIGRALLHITSFHPLCCNARSARFELRRPRTLHSSHTSTRLVRELIATRCRTRACTNTHTHTHIHYKHTHTHTNHTRTETLTVLRCELERVLFIYVYVYELPYFS